MKNIYIFVMLNSTLLVQSMNHVADVPAEVSDLLARGFVMCGWSLCENRENFVLRKKETGERKMVRVIHKQ